jgi:mono/diheme cytochrome c family protein
MTRTGHTSRQILLGTCAALALGLASALQPARSADAAGDAQTIQRGQYLATAGDCVACHTAPNGKPFAGGLAMPTPFGEISTPNITADKETGIGNWSDDQFYRALHEGIDDQNKYLYPAFPFPWYTQVTREDALAIKAYLFSLPPEHAPRQPLKLAFPFDIREGLLAWRTLFFKPGTFAADPQHSDQINRGAYLVEGLGHCGECHNHRNIYGASDWSGRLEGGEVEGWYAPNITADGREGIGSWSEDQLASYLKTGVAPGKGIAVGPMRETIDDSLSHLSDQDLHAMAAYLKSVSGRTIHQAADRQAESAGMPAGAKVYLSYCASCHRPDGRGVTGTIPNLAGNGAVTAEGPENVIRVVLGGLEAAHGLAPMPAVGAGMSDVEIADAVNYVRTAWGNTAAANAGPGRVADLRGASRTLLAGNLPGGCPSIANPKLAQAIDQSGVIGQLKGVVLANMLEKIDAILPKVKATGAGDDDIVNALTAAYCPVALADATVPAGGRAALLGNFSMLAYGQIKKSTQQN